MDNWEAPQWADFNTTVRSDIEDFFQIEHETHERKNGFDSFDESMDSRSSVVDDSQRSNCSSPMLKNTSSLMTKSNFPIAIPKSNISSPSTKSNSSSSAPKSIGTFSTPAAKSVANFSTPVAKSTSNFSSPIPKSLRNFSLPKSSSSSPMPKKMGNFSSPIPCRVSRSSVKKGSEIFSSAIESLHPNSEKKIQTRSLTALKSVGGVTAEANCEKSEKKFDENFIGQETGEEETSENNRTLVAEKDGMESQDPIVETENNQEFDGAEEKLIIWEVEENSKIMKLDSKETQKSEENLPAETEISTLREDKSKDTSEDKLSEERSKLDAPHMLLDCLVVDEKQENLPISRSEADAETPACTGNDSEDKILAAEKSNLVKLVSQLDPPRRSISENKSGDKFSMEEKLKIVKLVSRMGPPKHLVSEHKSVVKISGAEKLKLAKLVSQLDPPKRPIHQNKSGDKVSGEERSNLTKPVSQPNPPKRSVIDKKHPSSRAPVQPRVLTSQVRRYSISKQRRRSNQYVSLAEAVSKFQTGTPKRFRSLNRKDDKAGPLQRTKQTAVKLTCPISPALLCKFRSRAASVPNAAEREKLEIEEIRRNRVRPNPIKSSAIVRRPDKGPRTQSDSSVDKTSRALPRPTKNHLYGQTSAEKKIAVVPKTLPEPTASASEIKTTMDPPKGPIRIIKKPTGLTFSTDPASSIKATPTNRPSAPTHVDEKFSTLDDSMLPSDRKKEAQLMSTSISKHTPHKKMIPSLVSVEDGPVIKNIEILHFGIPINNDYKNKNITRTMPFSFDTRNKASQSKKEKLKIQQTEDDKDRKSAFHARPAPAFKSALTAKAPAAAKAKDNNLNKPMLCPLSFQERNELLLQKKKKMIEDAVEKEKQARVFHAKPAPAVKPVFVRGASAENLRASSNPAESDKRKSRGLSPAARQKGLSQDSVASNQENKAPNLPQQSVMQCPKLKNPLMGQNLVIKKATGGK